MTTWLTKREAADYIRASVDIIADAVRAGDLAAYPIGSGKREYRLKADEIDAWMCSRSWEPSK